MTDQQPGSGETTWRKDGYQGQHDEEGIVIRIDNGLRIRTPSIYEVAEGLGKSHHDSEVWVEYNRIADAIIADHTAARQLAVARRALERWRFLFAEHDPDDVHPLHFVNVIAQTYEALAEIVNPKEQ